MEFNHEVRTISAFRFLTADVSGIRVRWRTNE